MKCSLCGQEKEESHGCVAHTYVCGKERFKPILFGEEGCVWSKTLCHECFAPIGKPHHAGCREALCPVCRHHIINCGCVIKVVDVAPVVIPPLPTAESIPRRKRKGRLKPKHLRLYKQANNRVTWPIRSYDRRPENGLLFVYNICGLGNRENTHYYTHALRSILQHTGPHDEVVISGCCTSEHVKQYLTDEFRYRGVSFNFIESAFPVNVTFNHTVAKCVERFGRFAGYTYVDSGIQFREDTITELRKRLDGNKYAMITAEASNDNGYQIWFGRTSLPEGEGDFIVPIGRTLNLHVTVFSDELFAAYDGRIIPDIFASYSTESVFSFQCAALKKQFCVCRGVVVDHAHAMDGGASGFRGPGFGTADHVLMGPTMKDICAKPEGTDCGFGYEEFRQFKMHKQDQFDENQHCINDQLLPFMKQNVFLSKELLDYEKIHYKFINRH